MTCSNIGTDILGSGKPLMSYQKSSKKLEVDSDSRSDSVNSDKKPTSFLDRDAPGHSNNNSHHSHRSSSSSSGSCADSSNAAAQTVSSVASSLPSTPSVHHTSKQHSISF